MRGNHRRTVRSYLSDGGLRGQQHALRLVSTPGSVVCAILTVFLGGYAAKHGRYRGMTIWWCLLSLASGVLMLFVGTPATDGFAFLFCMVAIFPMGVGQAMQQIVPYTYPMKVLEPKDLAAAPPS